jgi:hypothetical protein
MGKKGGRKKEVVAEPAKNVAAKANMAAEVSESQVTEDSEFSKVIQKSEVN